MIEKRRRDRINNSLSELRRLVPTAVEKQVRDWSYWESGDRERGGWTGYTGTAALFNWFGLKGSAKLEKAEILQMTVDHLKLLQAGRCTGNHTPWWPHRLTSAWD